MSYPNNLKVLQDLCKQNGLKFKGKRKAELIEKLKANSVSVVSEDDIDNLQVRCLRERCKESGLSVYGTKAELIRRLKSHKEGSLDVQSIPVVQWTSRGRKVTSRPSEKENVDEISTDDEEKETSKYDNLKKNY